MIKVRDGYGKLIGSDYNGNIAHVLLSNGGNLQYAVGSTASTLVLRNASGQIESSVASTVAPFVISSTKVNANLNADLLDGFLATGLFQSLTSAADKNLYIKIGDTEKEVPLLYASYLGGVTKEGLFTELTNVNDSTNPNSIKVTIGGTTKYLRVGYADNAASASKVGKKLIIKANSGTTENTNLYTFDGSADKTINMVAGSNITITPTANTLTIASSYVNTTYTLSGALTDSDKTYTVTLTPNSGNPTTAVIPSMTGATSSASGKAGLVPVPATGNRLQFLRGDGTWLTPTDTKNTAGSTNSTSKLFLIGATEQSANPQTYSNSAVFATAGILNATAFVSGTGTSDFTAGTVKLDVLNIPTSSGGTTFGPGSNGQVLKSNGTTVYWASDSSSNSWRAIQVNGTQIAGTGTDTYALNFISGTGITVAGTSGSSSAANSITITNAGVRSVAIGTGSNSSKVAVNTNGTTAYLTIPYATESRYLQCPDTRNTNIVPTSYSAGLSADFKSKSITGLTAAYAGVITFRPYSNASDWTGGPIHNLAFDANGIHHRTASSDTWGSWKTLAYISDIPSITITNSGSGNVITGLSSSGHTITATKGSFLPVTVIAANTNVANLKDTALYYTDTDSNTATLTNGPSTNSFAMLLLKGYESGNDLRRYRLALDGYGSARLFNDRSTDGTGGTWYDVLTNNNSSVTGDGGSTWGSSITVKINGASKTLTIPSNPNTHWTTRIYAGASGTAANAAATNPYLKVTDDNTYRNLVRFVGGGATTVSSDASGNITISSTNTTYDLGISDYTVKISGTTKNFVRDWGHGATDMNHVATAGRSSMGMASLTTPSGSTASYVNPNGATDWHHFINIAYTDGGGGSNSWITQIANKAGTTDLWVRSRSGGTISNTSAWAAGWTRILTGTNYTNLINTTNFPGLNKTGTVTSVTVTGSNGLSGSGTVTTSGTITLSNAGVRSATISGNYLRVNTNGTNNDLTIPYASSAGALGNYSIQHFMTYDNGNSSYLAASFTNENFSKKAAEKYIEYWDSTGGWFNSRWGLVLAISGFHRVGSSDSYVLLGGGGHKAVSDFAPASHSHSYVSTGGMVNGAYAVIPTYNGETGWHRIATIDGGTGYGSWILYLCGDWSWASNTSAILHINTMHTTAKITQVSGIVGFVTDVRLVPISANNYYVDVYINYSGANTPGTVYCYFLGNGAIATRTTVEKITASVSTAASITLVTGTKTNDNSYAAHFYENSDVMLKTNIKSITDSDNMPILKSFNWKSDGSHGYGLIAQELEAMGYPELVSGELDGTKTVNYSAALSLIVGKMQVKIKELEKEIEILKNKN